MENNNQTNNQSNSKIYLVIIVILVVVIAVLAAVLFFNKKDNVETTDSNSNSSVQSGSNSNTQSSSNENANVGEYVTDADYVIAYNNAHSSTDITNEDEPIKVPNINFNTADAEKVNAEIMQKYLEYATSIQEAITCEASGEDILCERFSIGYKTYSTDTTVSIVVLFQSSLTASPIPSFLVYNFDIETGKLLTINDLLTKVGMTKDELIEKTMTDINALAASENYVESGLSQSISEMKTFVTNNISLNKTEITDGEGIAYFFDENGKLVAVTTLICPNFQNGTKVAIVPNSAS